MKHTITKKLLVILSVVMLFTNASAQTNATEKQKQDEQGTAFKKWFDSGDIIIEGTVEDWMPFYFTNSSGQMDEGGLCYKVKIARVLKGFVIYGYINIKTGGSANSMHPENLPLARRPDPENRPAGSIYYSPGATFLIKIKKTDAQDGCFTVENTGVFNQVGEAKSITSDNKNSYYKMLQEYCGVKTLGLEKKSPVSTQKNNSTHKKGLTKDRIEFLKIHPKKVKVTSADKTTSTTADLVIDIVHPYTVDSLGSIYFEFDIVAYLTAYISGSQIYFDNCVLHIQYNPAAFGTYIAGTGNITVTQGANFPAPTYADPNPHVNNVGSDTIDIGFGTDPSKASWNRTLLTGNGQTLMHVTMKVANCANNAGVFAVYNELSSLFNYYAATATATQSNTIPFDTTFNVGNLTTLLPCGLQITSISPNSVIAGADYGTSQTGESLLTINGNGFGNQIGIIYMANAVNNSPPLYIPLDKYDIVNWANNQINLLVPSVLFSSSLPAKNPNYPGTGYIYVKPFGSTDSVSSSTIGTSGIVNVPYALLNRSFSNTSKERIPFAYRHVTDASGSPNADTAAYSFRFDAATVTGNSNINCRPLLKQAIKDWQCGLPIRYRIGKDTTITTSIPDGISYIKFKSGTGTDTLSSPSFAAETRISVNTCNSGLGYSYATEADISFLAPVNWFYVSPSAVPFGSGNNSLPGVGQADFFTTALHELGHASLLLHVNQISDLMYFKIPSTGIGPYISSDDQAGGIDNKNWSKTLTLGTCPFNAFVIPSSGAEVCTDPENGIEQINNTQLQLSVYPNPAGDYLNVTFVKDKESSNTVKLTNLLGQTVFYRNIGKNEGANEVINLAGLAKGVYILIVTDNQNTVTKKIIIE